MSRMGEGFTRAHVAHGALQLGAMTVQRVCEIERWPIPFDVVFPKGFPQDVRDAARERLGPTFIDPRNDDIVLSAHSFVVRTPTQTILIDTCNGNDKHREVMTDLAQLDTPYLDRLAAAGVRPQDVDVVLCTHLHPDHVGWNTRLVDGTWVPTFPNARYVMSRIDVEAFAALEGQELRGTRIDHAHAFADSVRPVLDAGRAVLVDDGDHVEEELDHGVWIESAPGHTAGHVVVHLQSAGEHGLATGDVVHHPIQLDALDARAFGDGDAPAAAATRRRIVERLVDTDTVVLPAHFGGPTYCRLVDAGDRIDVAWLKETT